MSGTRHRARALRLLAEAAPPAAALLVAALLGHYGHTIVAVAAALVAVVLALRMLLTGPPRDPEPAGDVPQIEDVMPDPAMRRRLDEAREEWRRNIGGER